MSSMYKELLKLNEARLGRDKPSVLVCLSESEIKTYLLNLVRNDFAFALAREAKRGITVTYESLGKPETFARILCFLDLDLSTLEVANVLANPSLRKLPAIPDSNIPHEKLLREVTESCYRYYRDGDSEGRSAAQVFDAQLREIERAFS